MGKSSPKAPPPPDYIGAAQAQGAANKETAIAQGYISNPNIYGPLGSQAVTWGANNQPTITQTLPSDALATLQAQQQVERKLAELGVQGATQASGLLSTPFASTAGTPTRSLASVGAVTPLPALSGTATGVDTSGLSAMPVTPGTTAQQAILSRLEPALAREAAATRQQLANQGITSGSEAWRNAMTDETQRRNDLLSQAALQGINVDLSARQQGFGEAAQRAQAANAAVAQNQQSALSQNAASNAAQQQAFNQALGGAQFGNEAQQQALAQQLMLYNQPLNAITALMSGSQLQLPQFQGYTGAQMAPPDIFGATQRQGQAAMDAYGQQMAAHNANTSGLYGLLGSGAMAYF